MIHLCMKINTEEFDTKLFNTYPSIIEKLIFFKHDRFKVFYGGPIDKKSGGVKWLMPIAFEDYRNKTRAVYEVAFVNCDLHNATDAEILFIEVSDINIKLKNTLSPDYALFSSLLNGEYKNDKYIVIRCADMANIFYPDIFIFSEYGKKIKTDKHEIVKFLHEQFKTQDTFKDFYTGTGSDEISCENEDEVIYNTLPICINFNDTPYHFSVTKRIKKNDLWKAYYIITKEQTKIELNQDSSPALLRLDSGCISGQIYNDEACDCLDQLHDALKHLALDDDPNGIIIHIPAHDGRGFGTAPKAETEIYKRGGKGRIHSTVSLDTVTAAKWLYGVDKYDLRSFDGAAEILKTMNIKKVILLTDNVEKVSALQRHGIEVIRQKTNTNKTSCLKHIQAKKESSLYFPE